MKTTTRLALVVAIAICFFVAEIAIGFRTKSLALIADAFHYLNDIVAYAIAFVAAYLQDKGHNTVGFTYAFHRAELVGAFFNGVFLLALALSIFLQSIERFIHIEEVNTPVQVMIIGLVGLFLNIVSVLLVHEHGGHGHSHGPSSGHGHGPEAVIEDRHLPEGVHAKHHHTLVPPTAIRHQNLGLLAVLIHLFGDAVNNVGVIVTGVLIWKLHSPHRFYADPAVSLGISFVIFASAIPMTIKAGRILLEAAPVELDLDKVQEDLLAHERVLAVHDLHVWILSQTVTLASLHVCVPAGTSLEDWERTERSLQHCFSAYGVNHVTMSPEVFHEGVSQTASGDDTIMCKSGSQEGKCAVGVLRKRAATESA
ncbi:cation efflux protein [Mycena amicta]|nr:cation efflux protein [Mycena amicta]